MDPAALALIPLAGVITAGLIAGLFMLAGKRSDAQLLAATAAAETEKLARVAADEARRDLLADKNERIAMLTLERDEARSDAEVATNERTECRRHFDAIVLELALPWTKGSEAGR